MPQHQGAPPHTKTVVNWLIGLSLAGLLATGANTAVADGSLEAAALGAEPTAAAEEQAEIVGPATVVDGDTIEINGKSIELAGIDAPELDQTCKVIIFSWPCGEDATKMLASLVTERDVTCRAVGQTESGRDVAVCRTTAVELNETMIRIGMAVALPGSGDGFADDQEAARALDVGVWRSSFDPPWEWRADNDEKEEKHLVAANAFQR